MASNSSISHYPQIGLPPFYNHHMIPFQTDHVTSPSTLIPVGLTASGINNTPGVVFPGSPTAGLRDSTIGMIAVDSSSSMSNMAVTMSTGNPLCNVPVQDPMSTLAVDWTPSEQATLEEGLVRFAHVPGIMKYVKIAAFMNDKTVRDVALRCQWMCKTDSGKWSRQEENSNWKKAIDRKEKILHCTMQPNLMPSQYHSMHCYPSEMIEREHKQAFWSEVSGADEAICHLLEQNVQIFCQVVCNQDKFKLQDNIDLLSRARDNITTITNRMNETPGIMGVMPPMPVAIRDDLANIILLGMKKNPTMGDASVTNQLKQEFYYG